MMKLKNPRLLKLFFRMIRNFFHNKRLFELLLQNSIDQINHSPNLKSKLTLKKDGENTNTIYIKHRFSISQEFDAFAIKIGTNKYMLSMNYGVFFKIYDIFNVLLSEKNSTFYKLVSGEEEYNPIKADLYFDILYEYALKVVICHELGHIVNGHVDYGRTELGKKDFKYHMNEKLNNINDRLYFEMDADNFSSATIVSQLIYQKNIEHYNKEMPLIQDFNHALFLIIVASSTVYSSLNYYCYNNQWMPINFSELDYLPGRARYFTYFLYTLNYFSVFAKHDFFMTQDSFNKEILNLEHFTYVYFRDVLGNKVYFDRIAQPLSDNHIKQIAELEDQWEKNIKRKLDKFTHLPIL